MATKSQFRFNLAGIKSEPSSSSTLDSKQKIVLNEGKKFPQKEASRYDTLKTTAEELMKLQVSSKADAETKTDTISRLEKLLAQQDEHLQRFRDENVKLRTMIDSDEANMKALKFEIVGVSAICDELKKEIMRNSKTVQESEKDNQGLKELSTSLSYKHKEMVKRITEQDLQVSQLSAKIEQMTKDNQTCVTNYEQKLQEMVKAIRLSNDEISHRNEKILELQREIDSCKSQNANCLNEKQDLEVRLNDLVVKLEQGQSELKDIAAIRDSLLAKVEACEQECTSTSEKLTKAENMIDELTQKNSELMNEKAAIAEQMEKHLGELQELRQKEITARDTMDAQSQKLTELENLLNQERSSKEVLEARLAIFQADVRRLESELVQESGRVSALKTQLDEKDQKLSSLSQECRELESEKKRLQSGLEEKNQLLAAEMEKQKQLVDEQARNFASQLQTMSTENQLLREQLSQVNEKRRDQLSFSNNHSSVSDHQGRRQSPKGIQKDSDRFSAKKGTSQPAEESGKDERSSLKRDLGDMDEENDRSSKGGLSKRKDSPETKRRKIVVESERRPSIRRGAPSPKKVIRAPQSNKDARKLSDKNSNKKAKKDTIEDLFQDIFAFRG